MLHGPAVPVDGNHVPTAHGDRLVVGRRRSHRGLAEPRGDEHFQDREERARAAELNCLALTMKSLPVEERVLAGNQPLACYGGSGKKCVIGRPGPVVHTMPTHPTIPFEERHDARHNVPCLQ